MRAMSPDRQKFFYYHNSNSAVARECGARVLLLSISGAQKDVDFCSLLRKVAKRGADIASPLKKVFCWRVFISSSNGENNLTEKHVQKNLEQANKAGKVFHCVEYCRSFWLN